MKLRDHPKDWCIRMTVYEPEPFHGATHSSVGFEGAVEVRLAKFLRQLITHSRSLGPEDMETLDRMTEKMKAPR
jgi:hypothetical protein